MPLTRKKAFPSQYFNQDDVRAGPIRAVIADVRIETVRGASGEEEKPVIYFTDSALKHLVVNRTNWDTIEEAYGPDAELWTGKAIELYHDPGVRVGSEVKGGVRVRIPRAVAADGEVWTWEKVLAEARKVNLSEAQVKEALKAKGLKGYSPTKDTAAAMSLLSAEAAAVEDIIPF